MKSRGVRSGLNWRDALGLIVCWGLFGALVWLAIVECMRDPDE